jgi:cbb3-type cytochrome oxidase subunit 3
MNIPGTWAQVTMWALIVAILFGIGVIAWAERKRRQWPREQHRSYFASSKRFPED